LNLASTTQKDRANDMAMIEMGTAADGLVKEAPTASEVSVTLHDLIDTK
jgi:hypothetical protein